MAQWDNYSTKSAPEDNDTLMIKDNTATGKPNKRILFGGLWNWMVTKMTNAVIANLNTNPKTVVGGLNALQSATDTLNSNLVPLVNNISVSDLDDATVHNKVYYFNAGAAHNPGYNYGMVGVWRDGNNVNQVAWPRGGTGTASESMSRRSKGSTGEWGEWVKQPSRAEVDALNNSLVTSDFSSNITYADGIDFQYGFIKKSSKFLEIDLCLRTTDAIAANSTIFNISNFGVTKHRYIPIYIPADNAICNGVLGSNAFKTENSIVTGKFIFISATVCLF